MDQIVIEVREVDVGYDRALLQAVTFEVRRGEIFVILGTSGCGKSTLLKHMIGLVPPLAGEVRLMGDRPRGGTAAEREAALRHFGVSYQSGALFGSMTLLENVCLPLEAFSGLAAAQRRAVAAAKLALVGLSEYGDYHPAAISGGMRKRAAIARALALDPPILFLDEPSAGLDPVSAAGLDDLILQLRALQGVTIVMVTHELESIHATADRCLMLDRQSRGVVACAAPGVLRDHPPNSTVAAFFNPRRGLQSHPPEAKPQGKL